MLGQNTLIRIFPFISLSLHGDQVTLYGTSASLGIKCQVTVNSLKVDSLTKLNMVGSSWSSTLFLF